MVTNWNLHWDQLGLKWNNSTLFTLPLIGYGLEKGPWPKEARTLFVKKSKDTNQVEKSWIGTTKNFRPDSYNGKACIRFEVADLQVVNCPEEFRAIPNGWHLNTNYGVHLDLSQQSQLHPAFFADMLTCNHLDFELNCFRLLRVLGIHDLHMFPQSDNRGKADGFFRFHKLSVIYDATLETDFISKKEQQIENYVNQLKKEKISFGHRSYTIKDSERQVWIITRGNAAKTLRIEDNIKVKEIPYAKLIEVYDKRLESEIGLDEFWDMMKDLT